MGWSTTLLPWPFRGATTDLSPNRLKRVVRKAYAPPARPQPNVRRSRLPAQHRVPGPYCVHLGEVFSGGAAGTVEGQGFEVGVDEGEVLVVGMLVGQVFQTGPVPAGDLGGPVDVEFAAEVHCPGIVRGMTQCEMDTDDADGLPVF